MILLIIALICVMVGLGILVSNLTIENDINPDFYLDDDDDRRV